MNANSNYETYAIISSMFLGLVLLAVGIFRIKKTSGVILIIISLSIFIALFLYTLINNQNISNALSAFSTIALSLFAGVTLFIHYRTMKDTRDRENRDRKERLLNEITEWAERSYKCGVVTNYWNLNDLAAKYFDKPHDKEDLIAELRLYNFTDKTELHASYVIIERESHYITIISLSFGHDLQNSVIKLKEALKEHVSMIDKWQRVHIGLETISEDKAVVLANIDEMINNNKNRIHSLACEVIERATRLKIKNVL